MDSREPTSTTAAATTAATAATAAAPVEAGAGAGHQAAPGTTPATLKESAVRVECLMNARYHASREAFLDTTHRWFMFAIVVFGAAAVVDTLPAAWRHKEALAACAAILAALDLTFDLSNRARTHSLMKRRYFELLASLDDGERPPDQLRGCLNRYAADEEPAFHALLKGSWNAAQEMVFGDDAYRYQIPRIHRMLQNIWRYEGSEYSLQSASKDTSGNTRRRRWAAWLRGK